MTGPKCLHRRGEGGGGGGGGRRLAAARGHRVNRQVAETGGASLGFKLPVFTEDE